MLLVVGCWLLVVGCWLLVAGYWLLVAGCWTDVRPSLLAARRPGELCSHLGLAGYLALTDRICQWHVLM